MQITISIEELRKKQLFVATPMYGGNCTGMFAKSMADLSVLCAKYAIELKVYYLFNESLITRARNYCTDEFMRSGCSHMLFIDADIGFDPNDVICMMALQSEESPYDVMGGPYPKKCISWEKIKLAVDKGVADADPNILDKYVGDYVFNFDPETIQKNGGRVKLDEPAEVLELGTGFMMVRRSAYEKYKEFYPQYMYRPDHVRTQHFDGSREIMAYFDCVIDPKTRRYLSEDYFFCQNMRAAGGRIWLCPWMKLQHVGSYTFGGSLIDLASIGASATADGVKESRVINQEKK